MLLKALLLTDQPVAYHQPSFFPAKSLTVREKSFSYFKIGNFTADSTLAVHKLVRHKQLSISKDVLSHAKPPYRKSVYNAIAVVYVKNLRGNFAA